MPWFAATSPLAPVVNASEIGPIGHAAPRPKPLRSMIAFSGAVSVKAPLSASRFPVQSPDGWIATVVGSTPATVTGKLENTTLACGSEMLPAPSMVPVASPAMPGITTATAVLIDSVPAKCTLIAPGLLTPAPALAVDASAAPITVAPTSSAPNPRRRLLPACRPLIRMSTPCSRRAAQRADIATICGNSNKCQWAAGPLSGVRRACSPARRCERCSPPSRPAGAAP